MAPAGEHRLALGEIVAIGGQQLRRHEAESHRFGELDEEPVRAHVGDHRGEAGGRGAAELAVEVLDQLYLHALALRLRAVHLGSREVLAEPGHLREIVRRGRRARLRQVRCQHAVHDKVRVTADGRGEVRVVPLV